jgi:hypothetical protein
VIMIIMILRTAVGLLTEDQAVDYRLSDCPRVSLLLFITAGPRR